MKYGFPMANLCETSGQCRVAVVLVLLTVLVPAAGGAQGGPEEVQRRLNQEGLEALESGEPERAAALFREALDVGELDLLYLNLGRALQRAGVCEEADAMFTRVDSAPALGAPTHEELVDTADEYRRELRASCDGVIVVACAPADLELEVDGVRQECDSELTVSAGERVLVGRYQGRETTVVATVKGMDRMDVSVSVPLVAEGDDGDRVVVGWTLMGIGVASLATGVVFSFLTNQTNADIAAEANDPTLGTFDADRADALREDAGTYGIVQLVTYGLGVALVGTGGTLLVWGDDEGAQIGLVPSSSPAMPAGVLIDGRF